MPSMKTFLEIVEINYLRKVNEYNIFYCLSSLHEFCLDKKSKAIMDSFFLLHIFS